MYNPLIHSLTLTLPCLTYMHDNTREIRKKKEMLHNRPGPQKITAIIDYERKKLFHLA